MTPFEELKSMFPASAEERIANALERIATALERQNVPVEMSGEPRYLVHVRQDGTKVFADAKGKIVE